MAALAARLPSSAADEAGIAKPISKRHPGIREKIAPLMDYHGANSAVAVETRGANKANKK